jgi:metal-dependent hydrolase (beta-lactamase superfamily II)
MKVVRLVVQETALTIEALAGVVVGRGHAAPGIIHLSVWLVELHGDDAAHIVDGQHLVAQQIADQVIDG